MKEKWNNYFINILNKYNLKISDKNPIVIFLDGKNITGNKNYNLISENKNSFNDCFEQAIKHCTKKFNCIAISGVDEVSFIFTNHNELKRFMKKKNYRVHDIVSVFSQYFFNCFNNIYKNKPVYWHCKCSAIPKGKIKSYMKHRSLQIYELQLTYFLKQNYVTNAGKIKLEEKIQKCSQYPAYNKIKKYFKGRLYKSGNQIELDAFFKDMIINVCDVEREENQYIDLRNF